jgi:NADPH-dependent 2,4-dienoyl-CoA reductase/sulfur reductase-like enzyme
MQHLILGNGPAGVLAAETIRRHRPSDAIRLVGDEPEPPYSRMAIPYLLVGNIGETGTYLRHDGDHYRCLNIELIEGRATAVEPRPKTVQFANGSSLAYDCLLLATGSRPVRPPIPGIDLPRVLSCWTLEDARAIAKALKPGARVLQMGAGFIGCIIMEALAAKGKLTVVEMGDRVVPRMMTPTASAIIERWCKSKGVEIITSTQVTSIEAPPGGGLVSMFHKGVDRPMKVRLSNGIEREFDVVICATGVKPAVDYLQSSGIEIGPDGGIVVDLGMRSSAPDVFAAGDCTEAADFSTGEHFVNAIQPDAADQALVAALNMVGQPSSWRGAFRMNVLATFGLVSSSFGQWWGAEGGDHVEAVDDAAFKYLRLEFSDGLVIGATSVGLTEHVGVLRGLIQTRARLTPHWKQKLLRDPYKFVDAYLANAQAAA